MTTLAQAHGKDASYYGERPDWIVAYVRTRDAEALDRANFDALVAMLEEWPDDYATETSGHWAVGYVEFLVVRPGSAAADRMALERERLDGYPVVDDDLYSQYESDERNDIWASFSLRDRIDHCRRYHASVFAARARTADELYARDADDAYYALLR
jgi:hypothetical protein